MTGQCQEQVEAGVGGCNDCCTFEICLLYNCTVLLYRWYTLLHCFCCHSHRECCIVLCIEDECHAPIHSDLSDSVLVISDCFWTFGLLMDHPLAPGVVPLDHITLISVILHLLYLYILMYVVASSPVCATTRLPAPNPVSRPLHHSIILEGHH